MNNFQINNVADAVLDKDAVNLLQTENLIRLDNNKDAVINNPQNAQILLYNSTVGKWVNSTSTPTSSNIASLTDVDLVSAPIA